MGNKAPWKIGMLIYFPVTSQPLIALHKEAVLSPCNFATTRFTACILNFHLPRTPRPMKQRTLAQCPKHYSICSVSSTETFLCLAYHEVFSRGAVKGLWRMNFHCVHALFPSEAPHLRLGQLWKCNSEAGGSVWLLFWPELQGQNSEGKSFRKCTFQEVIDSMKVAFSNEIAEVVSLCVCVCLCPLFMS